MRCFDCLARGLSVQRRQRLVHPVGIVLLLIIMNDLLLQRFRHVAACLGTFSILSLHQGDRVANLPSQVQDRISSHAVKPWLLQIGFRKTAGKQVKAILFITNVDRNQ